MKTHLVERLRIKAGMIELGEKIPYGSDSGVMREAADEIERLREALRDISCADGTCGCDIGGFQRNDCFHGIARAALGEGKE